MTSKEEREKQDELAIILHTITYLTGEDEYIHCYSKTGYELDSLRNSRLDLAKELLDKEKHELEHNIQRGMTYLKEKLEIINSKISIFEDFL